MKERATHGPITQLDVQDISASHDLWKRKLLRSLGIDPYDRTWPTQVLGMEVPIPVLQQIRDRKKPGWKQHVDQMRQADCAKKKAKKQKRRKKRRKTLTPQQRAQQSADNQFRKASIPSACGRGTISRATRLGWAFDESKSAPATLRRNQ